jgi:ABC-type transport system involved in multi-copper enzyme maturation permease subunit
MSGNEAFELVSGTGWTRGLSNMLRSGLRRWFKTRTWWVQCLIWGGVVGGITSAVAFSSPPPPLIELIMLFTVFVGLFPAVGVVIIMQDALVGEKREGTAAWVLSKPVTRQAFVLSKVVSNSVGILTTMVIVPCAIGYVIFTVVQKSAPDPAGYLAAMLVIFISDFFFLSLALMLGALFNNRAAVIAIPLAVLFMQQNLIQFLPALRFVLPWDLVIPLGNTNSLVVSLMLRTPVLSEHLTTLVIILVECLLFLAIGVWRFGREEF